MATKCNKVFLQIYLPSLTYNVGHLFVSGPKGYTCILYAGVFKLLKKKNKSSLRQKAIEATKG